MTKVLVMTYPSDKTVKELEKLPPACKDCGWMEYDRGSWCKRTESISVFNVITGETEKGFGPTKCHEQRYNEGPTFCGIAGRFFKPKR